MKASYLFICLICSFALINISCSKYDDVEKVEFNNPFIKEIVGQGKTLSNFLYNSEGKISESQDLFFYQHFIYNSRNRLVKVENAVDLSGLSSSSTTWANKTTLMTSANSEFTHYDLFFYNLSGQLVTVENYQKKEGKFIYTSKKTLEYEGDRIVKLNLHNSNGEVTTYQLYTYDEKGNVKSQKYYSANYEGSTVPRLISETTYQYDNKNNPFRIYIDKGEPGLYTNPNNIIETTSISYVEIPGLDTPSTSKTSYQYNTNGDPIKVIVDSGSQCEYIY